LASPVDPQTGAYRGKNCRGEEKVRRFRERYPYGEINCFYSDSLSDAPLAKLAGQAFMIQGDSIVPWHTRKESFITKIKRTYFSRDFIVFVFCGGMGTLVNFVVSLVVSQKINPSIAYVLGYALSLFAAYSLNAYLIFKTNIHFKQFIGFVISYIPNFLILFSFVLFFLNVLGWNKVIVYALAGMLGLPVTFILVKMIAFNKKQVYKKICNGKKNIFKED
jgi:putative flippase GtrA